MIDERKKEKKILFVPQKISHIEQIVFRFNETKRNETKKSL